jgi:hypothetical protein
VIKRAGRGAGTGVAVRQLGNNLSKDPTTTSKKREGLFQLTVNPRVQSEAVIRFSQAVKLLSFPWLK